MTTKSTFRSLALSTLALPALALGACSTMPGMAMTDPMSMTSPRDANAAPPPVPATAMTTPPRAIADMQAVLDALASLQPQPLTAITPAAARTQPSFADAYAKVVMQKGMMLKS